MSIYAKKNEGINLTDKTAAISGGTAGIGQALAKRFSKSGANVFVIGRNKERGSKVVEELRAVGRVGAKYEFIQADLSSVFAPSLSSFNFDVGGTHLSSSPPVHYDRSPSEVKRVAEELKSKSGGEIHYLVTTQGEQSLSFASP